MVTLSLCGNNFGLWFVKGTRLQQQSSSGVSVFVIANSLQTNFLSQHINIGLRLLSVLAEKNHNGDIC